MAKENKYRLAKNLIEAGSLKTLQDLLAVVDKTPLSRDIKVTPERFNNLLVNPVDFRFSDCIAIADIIQVDPHQIIGLVYAEILLKKKKRK